MNRAAFFLQSMKHSPIQNYGGIPGLTSWLIGAPSEQGLVRLMECSREHQEPIIPHSHRFDFHCVVLAGFVRNIIWEPCVKGDEFQASVLTYSGEPGKYRKTACASQLWAATTRAYAAGDEYGMTADQVHSIFFSRGASVLFFEGPKVSDTSIILEPVVDGEVIPTFKVEPWMFKTVKVAA
jgi:hypothetical protein